ncbi:MAG: twin-arginine translocation signal domain-containing protein, partial [Bryobacteraceae bacterium]
MMDQSWDRREFLRNAALAGSALALPANEAIGVQPASEPAPWFARPMRWAQLTLVENDPGRYDL